MNANRVFLDIINEHLANGKTELPPYDMTAQRIQQEIAKEHADVREIEKMIICDQALTAQVLRTANSAFYRGLEKTSTVLGAINRLGAIEILNIVTFTTQKKNFNAKDPFIRKFMDKLWQHSLSCAIGAQWLTRQSDLRSLSHEALLAGLLHDVGKLFLLTVIEEIKLSGETDVKLSDALVNQVINGLHTEQGYLLLKGWNIPETYCQVAREHHAEEFDQNNDLLVIVRLVDQACNKMGIGLLEDPSIALAATPEANLLGLSEVVLAELEIKLEDSLELAH
jgi:HD-like signal output (HDOD) protein